MKILVTGPTGQLGRELVRQGGAFQVEIIPVSESQLDITDRAKIDTMFDAAQPDLIINAAAYTNVDQAEIEKSLAFKVNRDAPENLARFCFKAKIPLVHISTDYVFSGDKGEGYIETDPVSPIGVYGQSKADGEQAVRSLLQQHVILRTSWLYGVYGRNFVKTMLSLGRDKKVISVVADQFGSPTSAADLTDAVLTIATRLEMGSGAAWGTYHFCGKGTTSWARFAEAIFDAARQHGLMENTEIKSITTAEYPTQAKRPAFSALNCDKIKRDFRITPKPWEESLKITMGRIFSETSILTG